MADSRSMDAKEKLEAIATLQADERWPTSADPKPDTESANHKRNEAWLEEQEWPSAKNGWLSRRGHPLHRPDFEYIQVHSLSNVRLATDGAGMRTIGAGA